MDWANLFFSKGRSSRELFWIITLICLTVTIINTVLFNSNDATIIELFLSLITLLPTLWISIVNMIKRLHDRDKSGWWCILYLLVPLVLSEIAYFYGEGSNAFSFFYISSGIISLWMIIDLGFLKGTDGPNQYGDDPLSK